MEKKAKAILSAAIKGEIEAEQKALDAFAAYRFKGHNDDSEALSKGWLEAQEERRKASQIVIAAKRLIEAIGG